ncbi:phage major capsid protein [Rummeliibacillus stabekisii]|uniref:phage major capsid protein n=1 Tax=Rummeliibacillus stabekisii TaxID=241244 RepID=UPI0037165396
MEIRELQAQTVAQEDEKKVEGVVNKPNQPSKTLYDKNGKPFVEIILPNAFAEAIEQAEDIKLLLNHDNTKILARTSNGSLEVKEENGQVVMSAVLPETSDGKDAYELVKKQLAGGLSFGFTVLKDEWSFENGVAKRQVAKMALSEISIVTDPAYKDTSVEARGINIPSNISIPQNNEKGSKSPMKKLNPINPEQSLNTIIKENRSEMTTADGAAVIPTQIADVIVQKIEDISPVFEMAQKFPSTAGSLKIARETDDSVNAGFVGEGVSLVEQQLKLEYAELKQKRVGAAITLTNQLINDAAVNMDEYIPQVLAKRVAKAVEKSILVGDGNEEFSGIIHDEAIGHVEVTGAITYDTLQELYLSVHPMYLDGSCFIMQLDYFKKVAKLKDANGQFILQNGISNGRINYTLFDIPVYPTDSLPAETPIVFGNVTESVAVMIKSEQGLQRITDSGLALKGASMYLFDMYADSAVVNPAAISKLTIAA